jgi:uncharacterized protein YbjQ (UPF0145 family)
MADIKIFTTPLLDNIRILEYKDPLIVRNVRAMSIIGDLMTRVRDIVGGKSGAYQDVMKKIEDEVIDEIKIKAIEQGANAIVGFRLDFDSIEGLLMGCAQGTAVVIENNS